MSERTYKSYWEWVSPSKQTEYTEPTRLLDYDGTLLAKGWARHNVFDYDRNCSSPKYRKKEWDFYQLGNENYMVQISFANISIGGYVSAVLVDLKKGEKLADGTALFLGGESKYILPPKGDVPNYFEAKVGNAHVIFDTRENKRNLYFKKPWKGSFIECNFTMDIPEGLENITTVLPFENAPTRYFMTTKQNCMPCEGTFKAGNTVYEFKKTDTFCALDWGRVNTPHEMVWYWGNGSTYLKDAEGKKHLFGFEITWAIGDESNATETCLFYDGKVHKFGAVDVEKFPKDRFLEEWKFISEDGRFDMTMKPTLDNHSDVDFKVGRMNCHQIYGTYNGTVTLDDGQKLEIKNLFGFCEYVENRW